LPALIFEGDRNLVRFLRPIAELGDGIDERAAAKRVSAERMLKPVKMTKICFPGRCAGNRGAGEPTLQADGAEHREFADSDGPARGRRPCQERLSDLF